MISRTSIMHYKSQRESLPNIARDLNVDAVVEGSVSRSGDHVRVTAQLIDARGPQFAERTCAQYRRTGSGQYLIRRPVTDGPDRNGRTGGL